MVLIGAMSGIVNSEQYCFFNALVQSLLNIHNVHRLLSEHVHFLEEGEGKCCLLYVNIRGE